MTDKELYILFFDHPLNVRSIDQAELTVRSTRVDDEKIWRLARAIGNAEVSVRASQMMIASGDDVGQAEKDFRWIDSVELSSSNETIYEGRVGSSIYRLEETHDVLRIVSNDRFALKRELQGKGIGKVALALEVEAAHGLGFHSIIADAAGRAGDASYSGYLVWPRLGFDGVLPPDVINGFPSGLLQVLGLLDGEECRVSWFTSSAERWACWQRHGCGFPMELMQIQRNRPVRACWPERGKYVKFVELTKLKPVSRKMLYAAMDARARELRGEIKIQRRPLPEQSPSPKAARPKP